MAVTALVLCWHINITLLSDCPLVEKFLFESFLSDYSLVKTMHDTVIFLSDYVFSSGVNMSLQI